jgi:hypothetical protein
VLSGPFVSTIAWFYCQAESGASATTERKIHQSFGGVFNNSISWDWLHPNRQSGGTALSKEQYHVWPRAMWGAIFSQPFLVLNTVGCIPDFIESSA